MRFRPSKLLVFAVVCILVGIGVLVSTRIYEDKKRERLLEEYPRVFREDALDHTVTSVYKGESYSRAGNVACLELSGGKKVTLFSTHTTGEWNPSPAIEHTIRNGDQILKQAGSEFIHVQSVTGNKYIFVLASLDELK